MQILSLRGGFVGSQETALPKLHAASQAGWWPCPVDPFEPPASVSAPPAPLHCGCLALGGSAPGQGHSHLPFHFPPTETIVLPYHLGKSSLAPEELGCGAAGPSYIRQDL